MIPDHYAYMQSAYGNPVPITPVQPTMISGMGSTGPGAAVVGGMVINGTIGGAVGYASRYFTKPQDEITWAIGGAIAGALLGWIGILGTPVAAYIVRKK